MKIKDKSQDKILRFRQSERMIHWAVTIPFMVCYSTAMILVFFYNPYPGRLYRDFFSWIHRISGICLIVLPILVMISNRRDFRIFFDNIKQAWVWTFEDFKWIFLKGLATVSKKTKLPDQGKFNAAEKLNFMILMCTSPLYIITGFLIWYYEGIIVFWLIHFLMALITTPLILGHIFMATINPSTRSALSGMISGMVDRKYVKHHHGLWYKQEFENNKNKNK